MENIEFKISQLIDNELSDTEQAILFHTLSEKMETRKIFAEFLNLKKETALYYSQKNEELLPLPQISQVYKPDYSKKFRRRFYFSVAASIVLAVLLLLNQNKNNDLLTDYDTIKTRYAALQQEYENKLSVVAEKTSHVKTVEHKNNTVKTSKKKTTEVQPSNDDLVLIVRQQLKNELAYAQSAQNKVVVTQNDFIGGKIVAN